jgi:hypothetical protein
MEDDVRTLMATLCLSLAVSSAGAQELFEPGDLFDFERDAVSARLMSVEQCRLYITKLEARLSELKDREAVAQNSYLILWNAEGEAKRAGDIERADVLGSAQIRQSVRWGSLMRSVIVLEHHIESIKLDCDNVAALAAAVRKPEPEKTSDVRDAGIKIGQHLVARAKRIDADLGNIEQITASEKQDLAAIEARYPGLIGRTKAPPRLDLEGVLDQRLVASAPVTTQTRGKSGKKAKTDRRKGTVAKRPAGSRQPAGDDRATSAIIDLGINVGAAAAGGRSGGGPQLQQPGQRLRQQDQQTPQWRQPAARQP